MRRVDRVLGQLPVDCKIPHWFSLDHVLGWTHLTSSLMSTILLSWRSRHRQLHSSINLSGKVTWQNYQFATSPGAGTTIQHNLHIKYLGHQYHAYSDHICNSRYGQDTWLRTSVDR